MRTVATEHPQGTPRNIQIHYRDRECGASLLSELASVGADDLPLFAFLDSYGGPDIDYEFVRAIAARPSAEALITFGPRFLIQFGETEQHRGSGDAAFGSADWQRGMISYPPQKRTFLVTEYHKALRRAGFTYTLQFELLDEANHSLFLLYGTKHPKGVHAMKYAIWTVDPIRGTRYRDPRDPNQQALDFRWEPDLGPLCRLLLAELDRGDRTVAQLRDYPLRNHLPARKVSAAVERLRGDGSVETRPNRRRVTRSTVVDRLNNPEPLF